MTRPGIQAASAALAAQLIAERALAIWAVHGQPVVSNFVGSSEPRSIRPISSSDEVRLARTPREAADMLRSAISSLATGVFGLEARSTLGRFRLLTEQKTMTIVEHRAEKRMSAAIHSTLSTLDGFIGATLKEEFESAQDIVATAIRAGFDRAKQQYFELTETGPSRRELTSDLERTFPGSNEPDIEVAMAAARQEILNYGMVIAATTGRDASRRIAAAFLRTFAQTVREFTEADSAKNAFPALADRADLTVGQVFGYDGHSATVDADLDDAGLDALLADPSFRDAVDALTKAFDGRSTNRVLMEVRDAVGAPGDIGR